MKPTTIPNPRPIEILIYQRAFTDKDSQYTFKGGWHTLAHFWLKSDAWKFWNLLTELKGRTDNLQIWEGDEELEFFKDERYWSKK